MLLMHYFTFFLHTIALFFYFAIFYFGMSDYEHDSFLVGDDDTLSYVSEVDATPPLSPDMLHDYKEDDQPQSKRPCVEVAKVKPVACVKCSVCNELLVPDKRCLWMNECWYHLKCVLIDFPPFMPGPKDACSICQEDVWPGDQTVHCPDCKLSSLCHWRCLGSMLIVQGHIKCVICKAPFKIQ